MAKKLEWRALRKRFPQGSAVWPAGDAPALAVELMTAAKLQQEIERIETENTETAIEHGQDWQVPRLTLERVRELYCDYRKAKVGIGGGEGIKHSTFDDEQRNLKLALGHTNARQYINGWGYREIEKLKDAIFRRCGGGENGITRRTAVNYMRAVKGMLDWAHRDTLTPYRHPEDYTDLFRFRKITTVDIEPYDPKKLKKLLKHATQRERLYVYLALNCGHYQIDIGSLRHDEIITYGGQPAIVRTREKTSHQNDFESLHVLWPETHALLAAELAPARNKHDRALLNENGRPLYRHDENGKYDAVNQAYHRLRARSGVKISFKQFRKIGTSALERLGGQQARRLYKAGTIDSGDKVYVREAFENLTPKLLAWGDELRRDGVLTIPTEKPTV